MTHVRCAQIYSGQINLTFPLMFNPVTWDTHVFPVFFGGTVVSDDRKVISAPSMQLVYFVAVDTKRQIEKYVIVLYCWERFAQAYRPVYLLYSYNVNCVFFFALTGAMNGKKNFCGSLVKPKTVVCSSIFVWPDLHRVHWIMNWSETHKL